MGWSVYTFESMKYRVNIPGLFAQRHVSLTSHYLKTTMLKKELAQIEVATINQSIQMTNT